MTNKEILKTKKGIFLASFPMRDTETKKEKASKGNKTWITL